MNKLLIIAICLVASLVVGTFVIWPNYKSLVSAQEQARYVQADLENRKAYYQEIAKISEEFNKYPDEISKINSALPSEVAMPTVFDFFQKRASEAGVILSQESIGSIAAKKDDPSIKQYDFSLGLAGSYENFKNFLSILEKSARIIEVENISFSSPAKNDPYSFNLMVRFYSY